MSYCKHCGKELTALELATTHSCPEVGLLDSLTDSSFIISKLIEGSTGSSTLGSVGGSIGGKIVDGVIGGIGSFFSGEDEDEEEEEEEDDWF